MLNNHKKSKRAIGLLALSLFSFSAFAAKVEIHPNAKLEADRITLELQESKRRSALLKAQIEELESELSKASLKSQIKMVEMETSQFSQTDGGSVLIESEDIRQPQILAIFGANNTLFASLMLDNGMRVDVKRGDRLPDDFIVSGVFPNRVVLKRKGKNYILTIFSGSTEKAAPAKDNRSAD